MPGVEHEVAERQPAAQPAAALLSAAPLTTGALTPARVLALQRTAGNAAMSRWLARENGTGAREGAAAGALASHPKIGRFHVFVTPPDRVMGRLERVEASLARMPEAHRMVLDPMIVVESLPGGRTTGGGYFPPSEVAGAWLGREHRTGVSDAEVRRLAIAPSKGLIAITATAMAASIAHFTVVHEAGHCVDHYLGIVPPNATLDSFRGVRYRLPRVNEYAAEAYARYIINPAAVCREDNVPEGENMRSCSQRVVSVLLSARAFTGLSQGTGASKPSGRGV
jgi:hypothetical protein